MTDVFDPSEFSDNSGSAEGLPTVELEFATLRRFREEMAPYLNYDGFFARSDRPLARDTSVQFRFTMPENFTLAEGTAVVAWTIDSGDNTDLVPGMALQFVEMGKQSRAVIDELVDFHIATGGDPFDLGREASRAGDIPTDSLSSRPNDISDIFDSPAPTQPPAPSVPVDKPPQAAPLPAEDPLQVPPAPTADPMSVFSAEPLPDANLEPDSPVEASSGFQFNPSDSPSPSTAEPSIGTDLGTGHDGFSVDMFGDDQSSEQTPMMLASVPEESLEIKTSAAHKPPRDIRMGLVVGLGVVFVAVVALAVIYFMGRGEPDEAALQPTVRPPVEAESVADREAEETGGGVTLVEEDAAAEPDGGSQEDVEEAAIGEPEAEAGGDQASAQMQESQPEQPAAQGVRIEETAEPDRVEAPAASQSPTGTPADRVVDIAAAARGGITTVTIRGNGFFDDSSFRSLRLEDPHRLWVGIRNIAADYKPLEIQVGSSEVERARIGHHPEESPPALYVVLDLVDADVVLLDQRVEGDTIRISVGRN